MRCLEGWENLESAKTEEVIRMSGEKFLPLKMRRPDEQNQLSVTSEA